MERVRAEDRVDKTNRIAVVTVALMTCVVLAYYAVVACFMHEVVTTELSPFTAGFTGGVVFTFFLTTGMLVNELRRLFRPASDRVGNL